MRDSLNPSSAELRWFGCVPLVFFGIAGGICLAKTDSVTWPAVLWTFGAVLCASYYLVRRCRWPMYATWMYLMHPIGWLISHLLLAFVYYVVIFPIGMVARLGGRDRLGLRLDRGRESYWVERKTATQRRSYFRQF